MAENGPFMLMEADCLAETVLEPKQMKPFSRMPVCTRLSEMCNCIVTFMSILPHTCFLQLSGLKAANFLTAEVNSLILRKLLDCFSSWKFVLFLLSLVIVGVSWSHFVVWYSRNQCGLAREYHMIVVVYNDGIVSLLSFL